MNEIELLDRETITSKIRFPFRVSKVTQIVVTGGEAACIVDFYSYSMKAPSMALFMPGQVIESMDVSSELQQEYNQSKRLF